MSLQIGKNTKIPVGLFNKRLAILAMQGAGKTYTAGVVEEEMMDYLLAQEQTNAKFIVLDPVGAHWGLREKFPIHVIGGDRGDIDLDYEAGHLFAEMITKFNLPVIFDLTHLNQDEMLTFATDFLDKMFEITKDPTHIILEEADMFAPQRASNKLQKFSLAAVDSIVRRGRGKGLGVTMITQRPAVLNKNVLTQVDASIILNITGQTDLNTVEEYLDSAGQTKKEVKTLKEKIMKFGRGQALLFSPSWLKVIKVINVRERVSFHAGAEPELGKPNPALGVKLLEMDISPLISFLNGDEVVGPQIKTVARTNEWMKESKKVVMEEEKPSPHFDSNKHVISSLFKIAITTILSYSLIFLIFS